MTDQVFSEKEPQSIEQLLSEIVSAQKEYRTELKTLRDEVANKNLARAPAAQRTIKSQDELYEERMAEVRLHSYYCPGCGRLSTYMRECSGRRDAPHRPIDMVSVEELLSGDSTTHTPAPSTANLG